MPCSPEIAPPTTTRRLLPVRNLLLLLLAPLVGCDAFLQLADPGYRQLVNPDRKEIALRPEWREFVDAHYREEARPYLAARGLPEDTPLVLESVNAEYWRSSKHSELHASLLLPPPPPGASPGMRAIRVTWRKAGDASSRGSDGRGWEADRSGVAREHAWAALRAAGDAVYARTQALARTGRYPQLTDFDSAAERLAFGVTFTHHAAALNPAPAAAAPAPDTCRLYVEFRHPTTDLSPADDVLTYPGAKLAVLFDARATPDALGRELEAEFRRIVTEESVRLAEVLSQGERR